jgi:hypothetical protein
MDALAVMAAGASRDRDSLRSLTLRGLRPQVLSGILGFFERSARPPKTGGRRRPDTRLGQAMRIKPGLLFYGQRSEPAA